MATIDTDVTAHLMDYFRSYRKDWMDQPKFAHPTLYVIINDGCQEVYHYLSDQRLDPDMYTYEQWQGIVLHALFNLQVRVPLPLV